MSNSQLSDLHFQYMDVVQHWHAESQSHAGGDALLTALYGGWRVNETVVREEHWFAGMRLVAIYHFELHRNGDIMTMPVIGNPYVTRFVGQSQLRVVSKDKRGQAQQEPQPGD